ncbi:MAG: hypothetical protein QW750_08400 [Zestosphaera sp.]
MPESVTGVPDALKKRKDVIEVIKSAEADSNDAVLKEMMRTVKSKIDGQLALKILDQLKDEKEDDKKSDLSTLLPFLLKAREEGKLDDKALLLLLLTQGNNMLPLLMMSSQSSSSDEVKKLRKELASLKKKAEEDKLRRLEKRIALLAKRLEEKQEQPAQQQQTQQPSDRMTELLSILIDRLTTPRDNTDKILDLLTKLQTKSPSEQAKEIAEFISSLKSAGLIPDQEKETKMSILAKKYDLQREIAKDRLETEKKLKEMELEKAKLEAQAQIQSATSTANMIKELSKVVTSNLARGLLSSFKPVQTQQVSQQAPSSSPPPPPPPPPSTSPSPSPEPEPEPEEEEKPNPEMMKIAHIDNEGNVLHTFVLPKEIVKKNPIQYQGKTYYKVKCSYDNEEIAIAGDQLGS